MKIGWLIRSIPFVSKRDTVMPFEVEAAASRNDISPSTSWTRSTSQDPFWEELKRDCLGCWSGGIVHFTFQDGDLVPTSEILNIRLKVEIQSECLDESIPIIPKDEKEELVEKGLWNVWNVRKKGDNIMIPIQSVSQDPVSTHKLWFDRILLRTSKKGPAGVEIGFWDKYGDEMRRTVVVMYGEGSKDEGTSEALLEQRLSEVAVLQQKKFDEQGFEGDIHNHEDTKILSTEEDETDWETIFKTLKQMPPLRLTTETVDIPTLARRKIQIASVDGSPLPKRVLEDLVNKDNVANRFLKRLQNGVYISLPVCIPDNSIKSMYFCNKYQDGKVAIIEVQFQFAENDMVPVNAILYSIASE